MAARMLLKPEHDELARLRAIRKQNYSMGSLLAEFIDNSNSARRFPEQAVQVNIRIYRDGDQNILAITDNASGIQDVLLGKVLGHANSIGGGTNNEHGMGLKQAALFGNQYLRKIETKTIDAPTSRMATFNTAEELLQPFYVSDGDGLKSAGTRLEIVLPEGHHLLQHKEYYDALSELQVIYASALGPTLSIQARNDILNIEDLTLQADSVKRHLFNPIQKNNSWVKAEHTLKGPNDSWTAKVKIGFISQDSERPSLPGDPKLPINLSRHGRSMEHQGINFYKGDRLILRTDNWTMAGSQNILDGRRGKNKHNDHNGLVLEVYLDRHFPTVSAKNDMPASEQLSELREQLSAYLGRMQPDIKIGQTSPPPDSVLAQLKQWNGASGNVKKALQPETLGWPATSTRRQGWKSMGTFGAWKIWHHHKDVVLTHTKGPNAPINYEDVPEMRALMATIKEKVPSPNVTFIHDGAGLKKMEFGHYAAPFQATVLETTTAAKVLEQVSSNTSKPIPTLNRDELKTMLLTVESMYRQYPELRGPLHDLVTNHTVAPTP